MLYSAVIWRVKMQDTLSLTLEKIQQAAIDEFLEKGFRGASLR